MVAAKPKAIMSTPNSVEIGSVITPYTITNQFFTKMWINKAVKARVMLDSGSAGNFMSPQVVQRYGLITHKRETPLSVTHIQGGSVGIVTEQVRCNMRKGDHSEEITFDVVPLGKHVIILGMLWLKVHNPQLDWSMCKVTFDSGYCQKNCRNEDEWEIFEVAAIMEEEKASILDEYHDLVDVFNIERARSMPRDRGEFNFKIDLIKGAELLKPSKPYWLTPAQMEEARAQIKELEEARMIEPSDSPMAAPLFFVPKKDGGQRMCIDYQKLNEITIRDAYPLPNMEALLEAARGVKVFSKFDLHSAYNMFPIRKEDRWKTAFVTPWGLYHFNVMHYGFVNAPACLQHYSEQKNQFTKGQNLLVSQITAQGTKVKACEFYRTKIDMLSFVTPKCRTLVPAIGFIYILQWSTHSESVFLHTLKFGLVTWITALNLKYYVITS